MGDERERALGDRRQLLLHKRAEETMQGNLGQDRVARLLQPENALFAQVFGGDPRRLPVALLDLPGVDQKDPLDAHRRRAGDHPVQNFWPRKRKNEIQRKRRRWIAIELDFQFRRFRMTADDAGAPEAAVGHAGREIVGGEAVDLRESAAVDARMGLGHEIIRKEKHQIHGPHNGI